MHQTASDIKQEMIKKMGNDLGSLFYYLFNEISTLTHKWNEFNELYGKKSSRVELLNKTAPLLFNIIQSMMWENLILGIAKLTDSAITGKGKYEKHNATLFKMTELIQDNKFGSEVKILVEDLKKKDAKFCRDWRNRKVAHADFELLINKHTAIPLELATKRQMQEVIDKIHSIYNLVERHFFNSSTMFSALSSERGALSLLYTIEKGHYFENDRIKRKLSGDWNKDEYPSVI